MTRSPNIFCSCLHSTHREAEAELADATDATHAHDDVADNDVLIAEAATLREQVEMSNYVEQIALAAIADDDDEESGE